VERVDDDDEGQEYVEEFDLDPEDIDWLMRMSRNGTRETSAAEPRTEIHSQNQETMGQTRSGGDDNGSGCTE